MNSFLDDALRSSCEGIMVKSLDIDAGYTPSKRTDAWLKVKRDYVEGLSDSLDLVPIGAWYGNGRKAGWYSPFLMGCYNPDTEEFQSVCRVMSGFSDSFYIEASSITI
nr:PREDICTED: DNA ligase 1-like isoform X2 [Nicotiana tabacum]